MFSHIVFLIQLFSHHTPPLATNRKHFYNTLLQGGRQVEGSPNAPSRHQMRGRLGWVMTTLPHLREVRIFHTRSMRPYLTQCCWALPIRFKEIDLDNGIWTPMGRNRVINCDQNFEYFICLYSRWTEERVFVENLRAMLRDLHCIKWQVLDNCKMIVLSMHHWQGV